MNAVNEQRRVSADFFDDPTWPVMLAEILAAKGHWKRADMIDDSTRQQPRVGPIDDPVPATPPKAGATDLPTQ